jgi:hypothetical protein
MTWNGIEPGPRCWKPPSQPQSLYLQQHSTEQEFLGRNNSHISLVYLIQVENNALVCTRIEFNITILQTQFLLVHSLNYTKI